MARVRARPEDFCVEERLGFVPDGQGQHLLVRLTKREANTEWVARRLAQCAGVKPSAVGYAGLKDREAVTTQWFSVDLAGRPPPPLDGLGEGIEVLEAVPHGRKLRRGCHAGNGFRLLLRQVRTPRDAVQRRLEAISARGVPNYFGEQRFGRGGGNVGAAWRMLATGRPPRDRHRRGLLLSTARALLFNRVLSHRVHEVCWDRAVDGDLMMLDGSRSVFLAQAQDPGLSRRVQSWDVHPTGPLWGVGEPRTCSRARELEQAALADCEEWCRGLERAGVESDRRALRLPVRECEWRWLDGETLELAFFLQAGGYATVVLRELLKAV